MPHELIQLKNLNKNLFRTFQPTSTTHSTQIGIPELKYRKKDIAPKENHIPRMSKYATVPMKEGVNKKFRS